MLPGWGLVPFMAVYGGTIGVISSLIGIGLATAANTVAVKWLLLVAGTSLIPVVHLVTSFATTLTATNDWLLALAAALEHSLVPSLVAAFIVISSCLWLWMSKRARRPDRRRADRAADG